MRYVLTSGLGTALRVIFGNSSTPISVLPTMPGCSAHIAVAISEPSTTLPSPVLARINRAAAMPPAKIAPLVPSPNAPPGICNGYGRSLGVTALAIPLRAQNEMLS
ncbi:unannotated protein [freshwater metagenome]|uniref:Unannotated protein n=1 Tax=freshwater metagenome TaxID=449393 RepID=A0A6J7Q7I1_9ZZZZ